MMVFYYLSSKFTPRDFDGKLRQTKIRVVSTVVGTVVGTVAGTVVGTVVGTV